MEKANNDDRIRSGVGAGGMGPRVEEFAGKENSAHLTTAKQQKERQNEVIFKHFQHFQPFLHFASGPIRKFSKQNFS